MIHKTHILLTLLLACMTGIAVAQEREMTLEEKETAAYRAMMEVQDSAFYEPASLDEADPSDYTWTERHYIHIDPNCVSIAQPDPTPEEVIIMRMRAMPTIIPMPYNQPVSHALGIYLRNHRQLVERMVGLGFNYYFPIFENALQRYGLPSELKYLACIESGLRQNAYSPARAAGLWQFIPGTGILYGLEINSSVDERYDLYKSTDAACALLKTFYEYYKDWHLAIAAYNCGQGNVNKAMARTGGRTFWEIYPQLPRETRSYVPLFIAATYVMTYHCEHNLCGSEADVPEECDTIMVQNLIHFDQISHYLELPVEEIESLNPQYIRDIIPASAEKPRSLTIPASKVADFIALQDSILAYKADELLPQNGKIMEVASRGKGNSYVIKGGNRTAASGGGSVGSRGTYVVRKGDTLGSIAQRHHTTVSRLKKANGLRSDRLSIGQRLRIP